MAKLSKKELQAGGFNQAADAWLRQALTDKLTTEGMFRLKMVVNALVSSGAPLTIAQPVVTGTYKVGNILTAIHGDYTTAPTSYVTKWYADNVAIPGATSMSYTLTTSELGKSVTFGEVAQTSAGSAKLNSSAGQIVQLADNAPTLQTLTLSNNTIDEGTGRGSSVGSLFGLTAGSVLSMVSDAGGRFALVGSNVVCGNTPTDYDAPGGRQHQIVIRESYAGATNSPKDTTLLINVNNIFEQPNLQPISLSKTTLNKGTFDTGYITGTTPGSTLSIGALPSGFSIDPSTNTWSWTGTGDAGTFSFTVTETLADSANSPQVSNITLNVVVPVIQASATLVEWGKGGYRSFQRDSEVGGTFDKGQGSVEQAISVTSPGRIYIQLVDATSTNVVIIPPQSFDVTLLTTSVSVKNVPARIGYYKAQISSDGTNWTTANTLISMGEHHMTGGQSLAVAMVFGINFTNDPTSLSSNSIIASPYGLVFGTASNNTPDFSTNPTYEVPSDTGRYRSAFMAEYLRLMVQARGVNVTVFAHTRGATQIKQFVPGINGAIDGTEYQPWKNITKEARAWKKFWWFQGHSDFTISLSLYKSYLDQLCGRPIDGYPDSAGWLVKENAFGMNCTIHITTIPNISNITTYGSFAQHLVKRAAGQAWCIENNPYFTGGCRYIDPRDIELLDGIHQTQAGNRRLARIAYRAYRPLMGLLNDHETTKVISVTRQAGSALLVATAKLSTNSAKLIQNGNFGLRVGVYAWRDTALTTPFALDSTTPFVGMVNKGNGLYELTFKLASTPPDTQAFDFHIDPSPVQNGNGSVNMIYDDLVDNDGLTEGRPIAGTINPVPVWAPGVVPPVCTTLPVIAGTPRLYQQITWNGSAWTGNPQKYDIEWIWDDTGEVRKNKSRYNSDSISTYNNFNSQIDPNTYLTIDKFDIGHSIKIKITAYNEGGPGTATTSVIGPVDTKRGTTLRQTGNVTYVPGVVNGFGKAFKGAAGTNLYSSSVYDMLPSKGSWTMEGFISMPSNPSSLVVAFGQPNRAYIGVDTSGNLLVYLKTSAGTNAYTTTNQKFVADGLPHHIVLVANLEYGTIGSQVYVDGVLLDSKTDAPLSANGTAPFYIGSLGNSSYFTNGTVQNVVTFGYAKRTITVPTAPYTGSEPALIAGYLLNGDGTPIG